MSILEEIVNHKKLAIEEARIKRSLQSFEKDKLFYEKARSLSEVLNKPQNTGIIAEFKRKSPSKGWFKQEGFPIEQVVKDYDRFGASGLSVLTDQTYFGGSVMDLQQAKELVSIPVLRKDFIIDQWQIAESKASGADVILLIAACLTPKQVKDLSIYAKNIGLEILLEIHNEKELDHICDEVDMVGVNNRNLETFEVNIETSFRLINRIGKKIAIAESGINDINTLHELKQAGFKGFLIGERFMREVDPGKVFSEFALGLKSLSGSD